jgi:hypothetical protein
MRYGIPMTEILQVRLIPSEKEYLARLADELHVSMSDFARDAIFARANQIAENSLTPDELDASVRSNPKEAMARWACRLRKQLEANMAAQQDDRPTR